MNSLRIVILFFVFLGINLAGVSSVISEDADEFYQRGLEYKMEGEWVKALGTWYASTQLFKEARPIGS
ncbi:hypothetical protein MJD09_20770 [bacterium]|nr:hypothetical protein [bacterium]